MAGAAAGPPRVLGNLGRQQRGGDRIWLVRCLQLIRTAHVLAATERLLHVRVQALSVHTPSIHPLEECTRVRPRAFN